MSELHMYRVEWSEGFGMPHEFSNVQAFTAADAGAQQSLGGIRVHKIEPLPDSPAARIPIGGLNIEPPPGAYDHDAHDRAHAQMIRDRQREEDEARRNGRWVEGWSRRFDEIAAVVWPGTIPGPCEYKLTDLVEAVRKMARALNDRDAIRDQRDALQKRIDAAKGALMRVAEPVAESAARAFAILEGRAP